MPSHSGSLKGPIPLYVSILVLLAALGPLQFGFHIAALNAPQDVITCKTQPTSSLFSGFTRLWSSSSSSSSSSSLAEKASVLPSCISMTPAQFALISSIFTLTGLFGALLAGPLTTSLGRRPPMRLTAILYLIGSLLSTTAASISVFLISRVLSGIAAGASTVIVPLYVSEVSPPSHRGLFGTSTQAMINVGILLTQIEGYFLSHGSAWRWIFGSGVAIAGLHLIGISLLPESPIWLATQGRFATARKILVKIRGFGADIDNETVTWQDYDVTGSSSIIEEQEGLLTASPVLSSAFSSEQQKNLGFFEILGDPLTVKGLTACIGVAIGQQLCGINSIIMYSVSLLNDLLPMSSAFLTIIISLVNLITTISCSPLPDRLGRKKCLLLSIAGQGTASLLLALSIRFSLPSISAISVLLFVGFFALGLGPVPFMLPSELVPAYAVGATQSWMLAANYMATFAVAAGFPVVNEWLGGGGKVYFGFSGLAVLVWGFVGGWVPESGGGQSIEEMWGHERID